MPPKRKKKAKTPKTQSQSQRQSVTVNINTTKAKRSKSRSRSALPASYPPQFAPTFVTSNQDFDRITPLLTGILQSQQQMFRDISVPTQPMIKAEEPPPPRPVPPPLPPRPPLPRVVASNFQKPVSLAGFGAPPPLQPSVSVQSSVMGSVKDLDDVVSTPTKRVPPPLPPRVVASNFQKPVSLAGFGAPPRVPPPPRRVSTKLPPRTVPPPPKPVPPPLPPRTVPPPPRPVPPPLPPRVPPPRPVPPPLPPRVVVSKTTKNDFVSTSLPEKKREPSKLDEPFLSEPTLNPISEPVQPSKKSMIPGKSFFSKTYNPKHGETLRGKELENKSRKDIKTEPAFVPEGRKPLNLLPRVVEKKAEPVPEVRKPLNLLPRFGGKKAEPVPEVRKPLNLQPRIGAKKVEQSDNPPSKQSVLAQRLNPRKSIDDEDRPALEILKTEPPDYRSQSLRRATKEGEETIELLQKIMGSQSRPQETDAPPNIRPLIPPTRERSLSNMLNLEETPPPNIPEPIPKKAPEDRLSISEKKMIKRQKAKEEALTAIPEDIFPKKEEKAKERARAAIAERARAAIAESSTTDVLMDNILKKKEETIERAYKKIDEITERSRPTSPRSFARFEELDTRTSRASMEEVIEESKKRQKIPDEDLFKIAKQGGIISSVLPPKPPEPAITEPTPEKEPAYFIDIEPTMELDFRGKEIQETKQKREQPTRPAEEIQETREQATKVRPRPVVPKRKPKTRFISESSLSLDEPERTATLSPIAPDSSPLKPRGTSLDSVLPRGTSLDSVLSSGTLNRTPSTLQSIGEAPSPSPRPKPVVPKRKPKTRFISESSLSLDEPTLSPIPSNTTPLRPRGTSLDSVLPLRPRGTSLDSILSSGTLNRTPSTLQSIREEPSSRASSLKFV